jgi:tetratricopeptide (TPR) repeat protein
VVWRRPILPLVAVFAAAFFAQACPAGESAVVEEDSLDRLVEQLGHESAGIRERAFECLYIESTEAVNSLKRAVHSSDPEVRWRARRLLFLIRWQVSPDFYRRIGPLWDRFDSLPVRGRLRLVRRVASLTDEVAVHLLGRAAEIDPHQKVRDQAKRCLAGLVITRLNAQGCSFMAEGKFEEAEAKFAEMLRLDPGNPIALYNLACSRSLQMDIEGALEHLKKSIRNGYRNFSWAREDEDLANLRKDPRFERLLGGGWKD